MPSILEFLFFLGIALLIITLVGHGIWVFLAFIFRGGQKKRKHRTCAFCGRTISVNDDFCQWCMRDLTTPLAAEMADIDAVLRQLKRFERQGTLQGEMVADLTERISSYRKQLLNPQSAVAATVVPEPVAPKPVAAEIPSTPRAAAAIETPHAKVALPIVQAAIDSANPQASAIVPPMEIAARPAQQPPSPPRPELPPPVPRKSWAEILGGFLAERNIRWTELIGVLLGGLLMVGSSIALVIAFWNQLQSIPALQFLIFVGFISAVFAAGLFVYHRWKLESTGRGLMVIAMLLVPLNFLAMASFYKESWGVLTGAMELIALGIFTLLAALSARVLTAEGRWSTVLAVIGNSIVVLLAARPFFQHASPEWLIGAGCLPPILLMAAVGSYLFFNRDQKKCEAADANALFTLLGIAVFCTAVALGLLTAQGVKSCGLSIALYCLAIPLCMAALSVLAAGLQASRGMADDPAIGRLSHCRHHGGLAGRCAGTGIDHIVLAATAFDCGRGRNRRGRTGVSCLAIRFSRRPCRGHGLVGFSVFSRVPCNFRSRACEACKARP